MSEPRQELKLYACNLCDTVLARTRPPEKRCNAMYFVRGVGPDYCGGTYERIEELQITPTP